MTGPLTLRSSGNTVVAVTVWIFCLVALVDGILRGTTSYILHDVLVVAAVSVAAWMVFFRPRVIITDDGLKVINLVRSYEIGFDSLVSWRVGTVLVVDVRIAGDEIRKITSWGAPGARRPKPVSSVLGRNRDPDQSGAVGSAGTDERSITEIALGQREQDWQRSHREAGTGVARVTWTWLPPAVVVALIVGRLAVG